jgi:hypothetical protein
MSHGQNGVERLAILARSEGFADAKRYVCEWHPKCRTCPLYRATKRQAGGYALEGTCTAMGVSRDPDGYCSDHPELAGIVYTGEALCPP